QIAPNNFEPQILCAALTDEPVRNVLEPNILLSLTRRTPLQTSVRPEEVSALLTADLYAHTLYCIWITLECSNPRLSERRCFRENKMNLTYKRLIRPIRDIHRVGPRTRNDSYLFTRQPDECPWYIEHPMFGAECLLYRGRCFALSFSLPRD